MKNSKYAIDFYYISNPNGKRVYRKAGQWLTAERAEELKKAGYIVTQYKEGRKQALCI